MKELHPTQKVAIKIGMMLREDEVPMNIAMAGLSTLLVTVSLQEGLSKAEILNKMGNTIDLILKETK
jgi:hypothetical protein